MRMMTKIGTVVSRQKLPAILLLANSLVWIIVSFTVLGAVINELSFLEIEKTILFLIFYMTIAVTAVVGAKIFPSARVTSLKFWLFLSSISTCLIIFLPNSNLVTAITLVSFFGATTGIGVPSCLSYFADSTEVENRGINSGIAWSIAGISILLLAFLTIQLDPISTVPFIALWRFGGGIGFFLTENKNKIKFLPKSPKYSDLIRQREVILYLFPWMMFCILNFLLLPIMQNHFGEDFSVTIGISWGITAIVATLGGYIADIVGRKLVIIAGFTMLGVEYALVGLLSAEAPAMYCYTVLDGISWGLLCSIFLTTLWGDLGKNCQKEKYYVFGGLTFFLPGLLSELISPYVASIEAPFAFSLASFFLFISVLTLISASETLPQKKIKERQLRDYLNQANKIKMRHK